MIIWIDDSALIKDFFMVSKFVDIWEARQILAKQRCVNVRNISYKYINEHRHKCDYENVFIVFSYDRHGVRYNSCNPIIEGFTNSSKSAKIFVDSLENIRKLQKYTFECDKRYIAKEYKVNNIIK